MFSFFKLAFIEVCMLFVPLPVKFAILKMSVKYQ